MTADLPDVQREPHRDFIHSFKKGIRRDWLIYIMFVVLVMALAAIFVSINGLARTNEQNNQLKRLVECQSTYNEVNNERTRQLTQSSDEERVAERAADDALYALANDLDGKASEAEITRDVTLLKQRLEKQREARAAFDRDRIAHPVPPPPKALCGGVS